MAKCTACNRFPKIINSDLCRSCQEVQGLSAKKVVKHKPTSAFLRIQRIDPRLLPDAYFGGGYTPGSYLRVYDSDTNLSHLKKVFPVISPRYPHPKWIPDKPKITCKNCMLYPKWEIPRNGECGYGYTKFDRRIAHITNAHWLVHRGMIDCFLDFDFVRLPKSCFLKEYINQDQFREPKNLILPDDYERETYSGDQEIISGIEYEFNKAQAKFFDPYTIHPIDFLKKSGRSNWQYFDLILTHKDRYPESFYGGIYENKKGQMFKQKKKDPWKHEEFQKARIISSRETKTPPVSSVSIDNPFEEYRGTPWKELPNWIRNV